MRRVGGGVARGQQCVGVFFFNDTATTEIYTLSLHDALPIWQRVREVRRSGVSNDVSHSLFHRGVSAEDRRSGPLSKPILGVPALHSSHQHNRSRRRQYPLRLRLRRHARGPTHCWASWRRGNSSGLQRSLRSGPSLDFAQAAGQLGGEVSGFQSDFANWAVGAVLVEDGIGLLRESLPVFTMRSEEHTSELQSQA